MEKAFPKEKGNCSEVKQIITKQCKPRAKQSKAKQIKADHKADHITVDEENQSMVKQVEAEQHAAKQSKSNIKAKQSSANRSKAT